ncbi:MAG TPA: hypothetical protein VF622_00955, partial [Segetibacter sp.]
MKQTLRKSFYKNGYLIIIAAWLYTLSFIIVNYWSYKSSPARVQHRFETYIKESENTFDAFTRDTTTLRYVLHDTSKPQPRLYEVSKKLQLYGYTKDEQGNLLLSYWNSNIVVPLPEDLQRHDGKFFVTYANGEFEYIKQTILIDGKEVVLIGMIPIRWNYFLNNKYLRTEFAAFKDLEKRYDLDTSRAGIPIKSGDGNILFKLKQKNKGEIIFSDYDNLPLSIRIISIIILLVFLNFLAFDIVKSHGWLKGFAILLAIVFLLRLISYGFDFPFDYSKLELFDPLWYASSAIHPSLGDLLINIFLLFWVISFLKYVASQPIAALQPIRGNKAWFVLAGLCIFLLLMAFTASN